MSELIETLHWIYFFAIFVAAVNLALASLIVIGLRIFRDVLPKYVEYYIGGSVILLVVSVVFSFLFSIPELISSLVSVLTGTIVSTPWLIWPYWTSVNFFLILVPITVSALMINSFHATSQKRLVFSTVASWSLPYVVLTVLLFGIPITPERLPAGDFGFVKIIIFSVIIINSTFFIEMVFLRLVKFRGELE